MRCEVIKKSSMTKPIAANHDPKATPGEFALVDNEDGTLTLTIVDPTGAPYPIDSGSASMTIKASDPGAVDINHKGDFTWSEEVVVTVQPPAQKSSGPRGPSHHSHVDPQGATRSISQAVSTKRVEVVATVTWTGSPPYVLKWEDTITVNPSGDTKLERGPVEVTQ
jgi:hypothetical protein